MTNEEKARYEELSAKDCLIDDEDVIDYYSLRCVILEEENQDLKFQLECKSKGNEIIIKQMDLFMKQRDKCMEENDKLKKAIEEFMVYLNIEPNRQICKHSIKQTFNKLLKEVFEE